ncbi:hypothetical protein MKW94_002576 [Papaver nudicaule]|uniref:Uncharacterized protein n=1 Tax=Papaver nudicaule TaxID=74823 RepID=A0AA41RYY0_PAPNU|nr:hypothetical protein [Papaver nudicaule]
MLSISGVLGVDQPVPKVPTLVPAGPILLEAPGGLATLEKDGVDGNGKSKVNLPDGEYRTGGTLGFTAAKGLTRVDEGGRHGLNLKNGEVIDDSKHEDVEIVNGVASVKRRTDISANYKTGQVNTDVKTEANVPAVANVGIGAPAGVNAKNRKVMKDAPAVKKSDGNYK